MNIGFHGFSHPVSEEIKTFLEDYLKRIGELPDNELVFQYKKSRPIFLTQEGNEIKLPCIEFPESWAKEQKILKGVSEAFPRYIFYAGRSGFYKGQEITKKRKVKI